MKRLILAAAASASLLAGGTAANAQEIVRGGAPTSPIASVVTVPAGYDTIYVSGMTPPMLDPKGDPALAATFGDTKTQTMGVLKRIEDALKTPGRDHGRRGDDARAAGRRPGQGRQDGLHGHDGKLQDLLRHAEQPNKPSRITSQITSLVQGGMLVEIEVQAARKPK
jgi:enamine deaminase RidA (YjgF/YER057c/UK114 family)